MTQEDKELLLKDLCSRLPYEVKANNEIQGDFVIYGICENYIFARTTTSHADFRIENIKPYLFPLSIISNKTLRNFDAFADAKTSYVIIEFFNSHHIDYRGLIKKGLAIDATGLNIY